MWVMSYPWWCMTMQSIHVNRLVQSWLVSLSCSVSPFELLKHSLEELDYSPLTNQTFAGQSNHQAFLF
jgi:hypothetical protein